MHFSLIAALCILSVNSISVGEQLSVCRTFDIKNVDSIEKKCTGQTVFLAGSAENEILIKGIESSSKFAVDYCSVGVKDGRIKNAQMIASSLNYHDHAAYQARLDYKGSTSPFRSGSWSAKFNNIGEWLQVDLTKPTFVTGVVTQGRYNVDQWITSYKIAFSNQTSSFQLVKNKSGNNMVFSGNTDQNTYVMHRFPRPITARYFRLVVQSWHSYVSLRMEYITC